MARRNGAQRDGYIVQEAKEVLFRVQLKRGLRAGHRLALVLAEIGRIKHYLASITSRNRTRALVICLGVELPNPNTSPCRGA